MMGRLLRRLRYLLRLGNADAELRDEIDTHRSLRQEQLERREGARLSIIGLLIGGALSVVVGRLMSGLLYGVSATDGTTYLSVASVLSLTTLLACAIPARLASRVGPLRVLREE